MTAFNAIYMLFLDIHVLAGKKKLAGRIETKYQSSVCVPLTKSQSWFLIKFLAKHYTKNDKELYHSGLG